MSFFHSLIEMGGKGSDGVVDSRAADKSRDVCLRVYNELIQ